MSKITTVYEAILTNLADLFPTKMRIPNAYSLTDNNDNLLRDSWGLRVGGATPSNEAEFCSFMIDNEITVVFTREVFRQESSTDEYDNIIPSMLEDAYNVTERFFNYEELGVELAIAKVDIGSRSPVEAFIGEKNNFYKIECNFIFTIRELFKEGV